MQESCVCVCGRWPCGCVVAQAKEALETASYCPAVVVFDLDYCLWPFWCEMYTPEDTPRLYPEAEAVLDAVRWEEIGQDPIAVVWHPEMAAMPGRRAYGCCAGWWSNPSQAVLTALFPVNSALEDHEGCRDKNSF